MSAPILVVVEDLIFLSKIRQTAQQMGVALETADISDLAARVSNSPACAVILDLNHRSGRAVETARAIKSGTDTSKVRIVGFLSHVQTDLAREAREAGIDQVMARSAFTSHLPELLLQLAAA